MKDSKLYSNVKALTKMKGMKLGEVEKAVGISVGYFSRHKSVTSTVLVKLSDILEVSIDDIIKGNFVDEQQRQEMRKELQGVIRASTAFFAKDDLMKELVTIINEAYAEE